MSFREERAEPRGCTQQGDAFVLAAASFEDAARSRERHPSQGVDSQPRKGYTGYTVKVTHGQPSTLSPGGEAAAQALTGAPCTF